ncbi:MAG TPA: hypothetical protein VGJ05_21995 [Fimbriiglobus sp.]
MTAELDAAYFYLYGLSRDDVEYVLGTFSGFRDENGGMFDDHSPSGQILAKYDHLGQRTK